MRIYAIATTVFILLLLFVLGTATGASRGYLIVVGDSCGYELAMAVVEKYGYPAEIVPYTWVTEIPSGTVLVVVFTNITPREAFDYAVNLVANTGASAIVTDIFYEYASSKTVIRALNTISNEDVWLYCMFRDENALERVERAFRVRTVQPPIIPLIATLASLVAIASLQVQPKTRDRALSILRKLAVFLTGFFSLLHMKIRKEDIFSHPIRHKILHVLQSRGEISFTELQKEVGCSRATLEWHISLLVRARIVEELRVGRRRVIRLNSFNTIPR